MAHCAYDGALWVDSYLLDRWTAHPRRDCYAPNFGASAVLDANFYTESTLEECKLRCLETRGCNLITRGQGEGRATNCYLRTAPIPFDAGACALSTTTYDSHFLDLAATHFPGELDEAPVYTALPLKQCHGAGSIIIDPVGTGGTANHVALGTYRPCETVTYETYHPTVWYLPIGQGDNVGSSTGVTLEEAKAHCTAATQCNAFSYREDLGNAYYKNLRSSPGEPLSFINWYAGRTWTTQSLFNFYYEADSCMDASAKDCEAVCTANRNAGGTCNGIAYRPQWGGCYLYEFPEDLDQEDCADEIPTTTVNGASVHTSHNTIATYVREDRRWRIVRGGVRVAGPDRRRHQGRAVASDGGGSHRPRLLCDRRTERVRRGRGVGRRRPAHAVPGRLGVVQHVHDGRRLRRRHRDVAPSHSLWQRGLRHERRHRRS